MVMVRMVIPAIYLNLGRVNLYCEPSLSMMDRSGQKSQLR